MTLSKRIIPCLDVKEGRVVKGTQFLNLIDAGDPVAIAEEYDRQGADELVFLDITASFEKRDIIFDVVAKTAERCFMPLTVGGGVRTLEDVKKLLHAGADKVSINTTAVQNPDFVAQAARQFGSSTIVVAVDAKKVDRGWEVFTHGGRNATGLDALSWCKKMQDLGAGEILLTSMDQDGTKSGYDIPLLKKITGMLSIPVIASGGVGSLEHIYLGLSDGGAQAALAASIFHFGEYTVKDCKEYLQTRQIPVRMI